MHCSPHQGRDSIYDLALHLSEKVIIWLIFNNNFAPKELGITNLELPQLINMWMDRLKRYDLNMLPKASTLMGGPM